MNTFTDQNIIDGMYKRNCMESVIGYCWYMVQNHGTKIIAAKRNRDGITKRSEVDGF